MFKITLLDQDAQNLAQELIWKQIDFSVTYVGIKSVFQSRSSEFEQIIKPYRTKRGAE